MSSDHPNPSLSESRISRTDRPDDVGGREPAPKADMDEREFTHMLTVLSVSSGMVGVCLTAIGLIGIMRRLSPMEVLVDDVLVFSTLLFMVAAILSFLGLRAGPIRKWRHFARTLDLIFCIGLFLVVVATVLLTWVVL